VWLARSASGALRPGAALIAREVRAAPERTFARAARSASGRGALPGLSHLLIFDNLEAIIRPFAP